MHGMTMVRDAALLDKVQAGDTVHFRAEKEEERLLVMEIQLTR
ncbi:copper-binding protein [Ralstonia sp. A12]|nr:copper-binding protein [Ralstonia sp. A12]